MLFVFFKKVTYIWFPQIRWFQPTANQIGYIKEVTHNPFFFSLFKASEYGIVDEKQWGKKHKTRHLVIVNFDSYMISDYYIVIEISIDICCSLLLSRPKCTRWCTCTNIVWLNWLYWLYLLCVWAALDVLAGKCSYQHYVG